MIIVDSDAKNLIKKANSSELEANIDSLDDSAYENLSDYEIVLEEIAYLVDLYEDGDSSYYQDLKYAQKLIRDTQNGTIFHGLLNSKELKHEQDKVAYYRDIINEYKRLKSILKGRS